MTTISVKADTQKPQNLEEDTEFLLVARPAAAAGAAAIVVEGPAKSTAERLMGLAGGGQTLMSRAARAVAVGLLALAGRASASREVPPCE